MSKKNEDSIASEGSQLKLKGKLYEETELAQMTSNGGLDKSKNKKLELQFFAMDNLESLVYRDEHFFNIHELSDSEKVKVAVVSFVWMKWIGFAGVTIGDQSRRGWS